MALQPVCPWSNQHCRVSPLTLLSCTSMLSCRCPPALWLELNTSVLRRGKVRARLCENPACLYSLLSYLLCHRKLSLVRACKNWSGHPPSANGAGEEASEMGIAWANQPSQKENEAMSHPYAPVCRPLTGQYKYLAFVCVFRESSL